MSRDIDEASSSEDDEQAEAVTFSEKEDKSCYGSTTWEEDYKWLYYSQSKRGWMCKICELYPYSSGPSRGAFSTKPCVNTTHPGQAFKQHNESANHKRFEIKQLGTCALSVYDQLIVGTERINLNKKHTNQIYMRKCVHTIIFLIMRNIAILKNYGDMINFIATKLEQPITKQYLEACQKMLHIQIIQKPNR